jgi:hypothetical protein
MGVFAISQPCIAVFFFCSVQNKEEDYSSVLATILALGEKFKEKKK